MRKHAIKISLGALIVAGLLTGAALAEIGAEPKQQRQIEPPSDPATTVPGAPKNNTGLPPAPAEKVRPGVGSRALIGSDPGPGPTKPGDAEPVK